jgi:hypothetical protein
MICEATYCFDTAAVRFAIYPDGWDGPRVLAEISEHALRDLFGARGGAQSLLVACEEHSALIEAEAVHAYSHAKEVRLETRDFVEAAARSESAAAGAHGREGNRSPQHAASGARRAHGAA